MINVITDIKAILPGFDKSPVDKEGYSGLMMHHEVDILVRLGLAIGASRVFEFGTCLGYTTKILAEHFDRVYTIDFYREMGHYIRPEQYAEMPPIKDVGKFARLPNVHQFYGDTLEKHTRIELVTALSRSIDMVFVDAGHSFLNCLNDSLLALSLVAIPGLIVWHDFKAQDIGQDVIEAVTMVNDFLPSIYQIHNTWLAFATMKGI